MTATTLTLTTNHDHPAEAVGRCCADAGVTINILRRCAGRRWTLKLDAPKAHQERAHCEAVKKLVINLREFYGIEAEPMWCEPTTLEKTRKEHAR